jgi:hypothetical protein
MSSDRAEIVREERGLRRDEAEIKDRKSFTKKSEASNKQRESRIVADRNDQKKTEKTTKKREERAFHSRQDRNAPPQPPIEGREGGR